jgi:aryl-alcohol dehydrogenase-like predicted oxidoreductase
MHLGLGTAALGRPQYINVRQEKHKVADLNFFKQQGFQVLEEAYNSGIRYFDTAPGYGLAESLVLEWLQTKDDTSIEIATKWGYTYVANFKADAKVHEIKEHSLSKLNKQWNFSKQLLPYLKVYQIHSATLETGVLKNEAVLQRLAELKKSHQLKIGLTTSGDNQVEVIKKALDVTVNDEQLFDAFQVTYNLLDQSLNSISDELIHQKKSIIIKEALANGRIFRNSKYAHYDKMYTTLERLAKNYNVDVDAIALKFCEQTIDNSIVLSGASNKEHLASNLELNNFLLNNDDLELLNSFKTSPEFYWNERKKLQWN